ncbi:hypothetical protein P7K49_005933 [Saguinus oedipus]|uniref:Uncharacterized protein n=1 Tax=Saguinus oedipus TaxID=9490 RepID=A0ABQ9W0Y7_SAGOE|nr:hypothetical protein P7K49_005933 [Saguinus oedipus]
MPLCRSRLRVLVFTGALISHEKLLLQINPERELGSMSYKLGQCLRRVQHLQTDCHGITLGLKYNPTPALSGTFSPQMPLD